MRQAPPPPPTTPERIVAAIVSDIRDRRGLRQAWEEIDEQTKAEICAEWIRVITREMDRGAGWRP